MVANGNIEKKRRYDNKNYTLGFSNSLEDQDGTINFRYKFFLCMKSGASR